MSRIGDYELLGEIARGGMGVVYRARGPRGLVAIKVALALDPELRLRLKQELDAHRRLDHPGIVKFHGLTHDDHGRDALVMELVEGESLSARLRHSGPLPLEQALDVTRQLCAAVAHAHDRRVLHRDLKPANVLLTPSGAVKLTDFGLGKVIDRSRDPSLSQASLTADGDLLGTPAYMPPEQALGDKARMGPTADVYGLGATLFALLTGRPPFVGALPINVIHALLDDAPPAPSSLRADVPAWLDAVVARCLAKEPADRYPTARALVEALRPPRARLNLAAASLALVVLAALGVAWLRRPPARDPGFPATGTTDAPEPSSPGVLDGAETAIRRGQELLGRERFQEAIAEFDAALLLAPGSGRAQVGRGIALARQQRYGEAFEAYAAAIAAEPNLAAAYVNRATSLFALQRWDEAHADLSRAIALEPANAVAWAQRGTARERLGDREGALSDAMHAIQLAPDEPLGYLSRGSIRAHWRDLEGAESDVMTALALREGYAPAEQLLEAVRAARAAGWSRVPPAAVAETLRRLDSVLRAGRFEDAERVAEQALTQDADETAAWVGRALARLGQGRDAEAEEDLARALELSPPGHAQVDLLAARGRMFAQRGRPLDAQRDFEAALELDPGLATVRVMLGDVYTELGDYARACAALEAGLRELPTDHPANRAVAYHALAMARLGLGEAELALEALDAALALHPDLPAARTTRACLRRLQGDPRAAERDVDLALRADPGNDLARLERAEVDAALGRSDQALAGLDEVLARAPDDPALWAMSGRLNWAAGRRLDAVASMRRAAGEPPRGWWSVWLALFSGDLDQLDADPEHPWLDVVVRALREDWTPERLLAEADAAPEPSARRGQRCSALALLGLRQETLRGDAAGALPLYRDCLDTRAYDQVELGWARLRLGAATPAAGE